MSKIARDRLRLVEKGKIAGPDDEQAMAVELAMKMKGHVDAGSDKQEAWDKEWRGVYDLAEKVMGRVMQTGP